MMEKPPLKRSLSPSVSGAPSHAPFPHALTMVMNSQRLGPPDHDSSRLDLAIESMNLAKDSPNVKAIPAKALFASAGALLTMIRVRFLFCDGEFGLTCEQDSNSANYFQLGLACADMCSHLKRMIGEVELENLIWSSRQAIGGLTM